MLLYLLNSVARPVQCLRQTRDRFQEPRILLQRGLVERDRVLEPELAIGPACAQLEQAGRLGLRGSPRGGGIDRGQPRRHVVEDDIDSPKGVPRHRHDSRCLQRVLGLTSGQTNTAHVDEQQMIAIARALMSAPKMLMLDEPSLGLAPLLVKEIFENIKRINEDMDTTLLIVEQNAKIALEVSNYSYIMETGKIVLEGPSDELKDNPDVKEFYMGVTQGGGRKSFKEVKSYKRRKRWM